MLLSRLSSASGRSARAATPRPRRLTGLGVVCLLLVAMVLAPSSNAAAGGTTIVSVDVAPTSVVVGDRVRVSGIVRSTTSGVSGAGRIVSVFARTTVAGAPWRHIGSTRTDSRSRYNLFWSATGSSQIQVRFAGAEDLAAAISVARPLRVRAALGVPRIAGWRTAVLAGTRLTWTARTSAAAVGARVSVQVLSGRWREVAASKVAAGGSISVAVTPAVGVQRYRLAVQRTSLLAGSVSAETVVRTAARTKVASFTPFRPDGSVAVSTNFYDPAAYGRTKCTPSSVALGSGVWQCTQPVFAQACWVRAPGAHRLLCSDGPSTSPAVYAQMAWTGDESARPRRDRYPLRVTLTDGTGCRAIDGDPWDPAPEYFVQKYYCDRVGVRLLEPENGIPIDMSGPVWTAWMSVDHDRRAVPVVVASAQFAGARPAIRPATSVGCPVRAQLEPWLPRGQHWPSSARILCVDGGWTVVFDGAGTPRQAFRPVTLGWRSFWLGNACDDPSPLPPGLWVKTCQGS